ncbi:MAG TPA: hypothetical protein ENN80_10820 [Candidatus Hydrogenedentes bacterium]|nr:hypothetical protein [Candidatus Hydrogenedentota bacterium]
MTTSRRADYGFAAMPEDYDVAQCRRLAELVDQSGLHYRHPPKRHDPGDVLELRITGVCPAVSATARVEIERFVGSGFAGQVYRTRLVGLELDGEPIRGLVEGNVYAVKICRPHSAFSELFRNALYWLAFQNAFAYQVNESAARSGVLWQKLIRRAASIRFGDERCVIDTYATFFDADLQSFGEINEWAEGRMWRFEIDDDVFERGKTPAELAERSQEYLAKKEFMAELVALLHEMGAPEFARQYEWWTMKSQPNVIKRSVDGDGPADGLTALDFRAGLALLPFLPMSPADVRLILRGLRHGRLVQFDRSDIEKLDAFCGDYPREFADLAAAIEELKAVDGQYRASQPDVTRHHLRLLTDPVLRHNVHTGLVEAWRVRGLVDEEHAWRLLESRGRFWLFWLLGCVPLMGKRLRRLWGDASYKRHVQAFLSSIEYAGRALHARMIETLADWHREARVDAEGIERFRQHPFLFWRVFLIVTILPLPKRWQRFLTDWRFAWNTCVEMVRYPIRFYRDADFRVEWLAGEVEDGAVQGMLTEEEKEHILERVPDPFIQKYLKCVAVHVCTLPITQVISVVVALWGFFYLGKTWQEGVLWAGAILAAFQGTPISPGSLVRGSYVVYLMIKERNVRNYWVAALVSFWHYVGYLGFPLQMVREFPSLARFMAGRWATKMVGFIPVFGERGALLEHWVFDVFFNVPLTLRRRFSREHRESV